MQSSDNTEHAQGGTPAFTAQAILNILQQISISPPDSSGGAGITIPTTATRAVVAIASIEIPFYQKVEHVFGLELDCVELEVVAARVCRPGMEMPPGAQERAPLHFLPLGDHGEASGGSWTGRRAGVCV
ncbi:hypothetical protein PMKS-001799 [Pichia membranifaciens]|uniref:Uncharacterized protein n=1 Tax=Pichia membranifaciens TaxID=4926 RepID=A0A1Q2YFP0_9ASCO|nr:hypothetical protein PMKS-001799 [Pichia membranifaciens]